MLRKLLNNLLKLGSKAVHDVLLEMVLLTYLLTYIFCTNLHNPWYSALLTINQYSKYKN